ncbi:MAG: hypothetical protein N2484_18600 [Clostridia bacterium]|nr:hypothetical protein [Clostridia bacterium]
MTNEQKFEIIKDCINDIKEYSENKELSVNERQHIARAISTYNNLLEDAQRGKVDLDILHENIASYLYYLQ